MHINDYNQFIIYVYYHSIAISKYKLTRHFKTYSDDYKMNTFFLSNTIIVDLI